MSHLNQDLLASHKIISIMEKARSLNEETFNQLPDIMLTTTRDGTVLKINHAGSKHFGINRELILGLKFSDRFQLETWNIFESKLAHILGPGQVVDFELPMDENPNKRIFFYWKITMIRQATETKDGIYTVIGRDISALRQHERSLAEMFSSIPLGILTIGADCKIEDPYFAYCEHLLARPELGGESLISVLFEPCMERLSSEQKEGVSNLSRFHGCTFAVFSAISDSFPKRLEFPIQTSTGPEIRYLGVTYQPIVYKDHVSRVMIVLEDRTSIVKFEQDQEERELKDSKLVKRILQIKNADRELLPFTIEDTDKLLKSCKKALGEELLDVFCNRLHGAKGNANMAGFFNLVDFCHSLEKAVLSGEVGLEQAKLRFVQIEDEWREYVSLYQALQAQAAVSVSGDRWRELERKLQHQIEVIGAKLGKKSSLEFNTDGSDVSDSAMDVLKEVCVHLINNAMDHGIEPPEERIAKMKAPKGLISVSFISADGGLIADIRDDGQGLNISRIRLKAKQLGLIGDEVQYSDNEIIKLIFSREFSTAAKVTEISGRGIGLDAVKSQVEGNGGWIRVANAGGGVGTRFTIFLPALKTGEKN